MMQDIFLFAVLGLGAGAIYAILATGIVLVYRGSGVVNFAQGAMAMFAAYQYTEFLEWGMGQAEALVATVALSAFAGALIYRIVFFPLSGAPALAKLVANLGLVLVLQAAASLLYGTDVRTVSSLLPDDIITLFGVSFGRDRLWLLGVSVVIGVALWLVYRFSRFGAMTEAASESEKGTVLLGYSPARIGAVNWAIAAALSAVAGILIAPITGLSITGYTLLVVPALAAALLGRFSSFGLTVLCAIGLGIGQSEITRYWNQPGAKEALPLLVIIAVMVFWGKTLPTRGFIAEGRPPRAPTRRVSIPSVVVGIVAVQASLVIADAGMQAAIITSLIFSVIALSIVVVTGFVGQISLAQMTFAGVGALLVSRLADGAGIPFPLSILLGALAAVPVGVAFGLPALRVRGMNLAIVTLACATAIEAMVFANSELTGGIDGSPVPRPEIFGVSLDPIVHPDRYGGFVLGVLVLLSLWVVVLRRGRWGRRWLAVRQNERAAASVGVNVAAAKLVAFSISSFIAGVGGGMLAYLSGRVSFEIFTPLASVFLLATVYVGGVAMVSGALIGGFLASGGAFFVLVSEFVDLGSYEVLATGLALIVVAIAAPDGIAVGVNRGAAAVRAWIRARRAPSAGADTVAPGADLIDARRESGGA